MTPAEFENGVNNILDNTPKRGVSGSQGITKYIFKLIVAQFKALFADVKTAYEAGMNWRGAWSGATAYAVRDVVSSNGSTYRCKVGHTNQAVTNTNYWDLVAGKGVDGALGEVGAVSLGGIFDWNHISNAKSGSGYTLLLDSSTNGPKPGGTAYYHSFNFEYGSKNGTGNLTQLAVPYAQQFGSPGIFIRSRYNTTWSEWFLLSVSKEIVLTPNGVNVSFNLRRPYEFKWTSIASDGVTIESYPGSLIPANTDAILVLSGTLGKTLTINIFQIT